MAVKINALGRVEQKVSLEVPSRFDNLSKEDTADIFDDLVVDSDDEDSEVHSPSIAPATERQRNRAYRAWKHPKFWESIWKVHPNVNPEQVWVDLCKNDATAFRICKAFLKFYVASSKRKRLTLGPEGYVMERAVKSARSLNAFWKSLIAAADAEVLAPLWRKSPDNYQLALKRPTNYPGSADKGPVSRISHWIYHEGAEEMELATVPEYTTVEMTARDIGGHFRKDAVRYQQTAAGSKRKRSRCYETDFLLVLEGSPERAYKRARVPICLEEVSDPAAYDVRVGEDVQDDGSIGCADSECRSTFSLSASSDTLDTPLTQLSPTDAFFEPILWEDGGICEGIDDDNLLSHDLDQLLEKEALEPLVSRDDWGGIFACADAGHTGPKDKTDEATMDLGLDLDLALDVGYGQLVQLDETDFTHLPQEEGMLKWDDEEWGLINWGPLSQ